MGNLLFSGPALLETPDTARQREAILRVIASLPSRPDSPGSFCPVFAMDESSGSVEAEMSILNERYPLMTGLLRFRRDSHGVHGESNPAMK